MMFIYRLECWIYPNKAKCWRPLIHTIFWVSLDEINHPTSRSSTRKLFYTLGLCSCVLVLTYLEQGMFYQKIQLKSNVIIDRPLIGDVWAPGDNLISLISDCAGHSVPSGFFAFNGRPAGNVGKMTTDNTITVQYVAQLICSMLSNVSQVDNR